MTVVAILQARMTSTRLPGKVLAELAGEPLLTHELRRLERCAMVDEVVVATTTNTTDDPVARLAERHGIRVHRGSEHDVLGRFVGAARDAKADVVVRVTADCPLLDAAVVDRVVVALDPGVDYASNIAKRTFPVGLDAEALFTDVLERAHRLARSPEAREHVTWLIREEQPDLFLHASVTDAVDNSDLRWTVDTQADLDHVRRLYEELALQTVEMGYLEVVAHERRHDEPVWAVTAK